MDTLDPFAAAPNGARHAALAELAQKGPLQRPWVITGYAANDGDLL